MVKRFTTLPLNAAQQEFFMKKFCRFVLAAIALALGMTILGCDNEIEEIGNYASYVTIGSDELVYGEYVLKGKTVQFHATVTGKGDFSQDVTWSVTGDTSSSALTSTIDANGLLTVATGEAQSYLIITAVAKTPDFNGESVYRGKRVGVMAENKGSISGVSIEGDELVGREIGVELGTTSFPVTDATFQWKRADSSGGSYTDIAGAAGVKYTLTAADAGKYVKVEAKNAATTAGVLSNVIGPIVAQYAKISTIYLYSISAPVKGGSFDTDVTLPTHTTFEYSSIRISWYDITATPSSSVTGSTVAANKRYEARLYLKADNGYAFDEDLTVTATNVDSAYNERSYTNGIRTLIFGGSKTVSIYLVFPITEQ
jgi:hypothetical protein